MWQNLPSHSHVPFIKIPPKLSPLETSSNACALRAATWNSENVHGVSLYPLPRPNIKNQRFELTQISLSDLFVSGGVIRVPSTSYQSRHASISLGVFFIIFIEINIYFNVFMKIKTNLSLMDLSDTLMIKYYRSFGISLKKLFLRKVLIAELVKESHRRTTRL